MTRNTTTVEILKVGSCQHSGAITQRGESFRSKDFPALVALVHHTEKGFMLFDTGYSHHFFSATKKFPERLYRMTTPMDLPQEEELIYQLEQRGISPDQIGTIFISHFHADHISGLRDFPQAKFLCSRMGLEKNRELGRFAAVGKGFLQALLPEDFDQRVSFIENEKPISLDQRLSPFVSEYALEGWDNLVAIELPGHAYGQYGLLVKSDEKSFFFVSDSCWSESAYTKGELPMALVRVIKDDYKQYLKTIENLATIHKTKSDIAIVPSHCSQSYQRWRENHAK